MKKILFWPYQLYAWLVVFPLVGILTVVFSTLTVISSALINPHFASRVFGSTWARLLAWLVPIRVTVQGAENAEPHRSYVVASNHQSACDILVIYGWLRLDLKWVMKAELRKVPGIGIGCEKAGHIFIDRHNPKQAAETINRSLARLGDGIGILFFPEGTRSPDGRLLPFKKGAFHTAIGQQIPILPVTVTGTREILPSRSLTPFPGPATLHIHPAIETTGLTLDEMENLRQKTREVIAAALPGDLS